MQVHLYKNDLPDNVTFSGDLAIDTETMGLNFNRDRLCCVQISDGNGDAHIVHFTEPNYSAPNLKKVLSNENRAFIFHYARFDVATIYKYLGVLIKNLYCTKIASKLARTYTESHSLKELCREILNINISKQQQSSYWGNENLTDEQISYAAADVLYLHKLRSHLKKMLAKEKRTKLANDCFRCVPTMALLDLQSFNGHEIFAVKSS